MLTNTILAFLIVFFAYAAFCSIMIPILHRMKFGQQARDDGPQSHLKKNGMPTMGGIMTVLAIAFGCLPFFEKAPETLLVMGFTLTSGFIGFLDDFSKTHRKQSKGLKAWQKFSLQLIAIGVFAYWPLQAGNYDDILLPSSGSFEIGILLPLGGPFAPFVLLVVLGTDNGVNFTDGLSGLCSSMTVVVALFFVAVICRFVLGAAPVSGAVIGTLLGFLPFNCCPAKASMDDTGALVLGGHMAAVALVPRMPLFLMLVGIIHMLEVISVMLQVGYFKATKGERLFRMVPLRHYFELGGWSETRAITVLTTCTVILSLAAWIGLGE